MTRGARLAELRIQRRISQSELANLSGVKQGAISNYETGKRNPGIDVLQLLLPHLGISLAEFLMPEPFAVTLEGEVVPIDDEENARLDKAISILEGLDDGELALIEGLANAIRAQRQVNNNK